MASFPRSMFNSETNYVKANYISGNNPIVKLTDLKTETDSDGNITRYYFNDKTSNLKYLQVDNYFNKKSMEACGIFAEDMTVGDFSKWYLNGWQPFVSNPFSNNNKIISLKFNYLSNAQGVFNNCANLRTVYVKCLNIRGSFDWSNCANLEEVVVENITNISGYWTNNNWLNNNPKLHKLILNGFNQSGINLTESTAFNRQELIEFINSLGVVSNNTVILGSTNLAKLTEEDKKIATDKGWTLA